MPRLNQSILSETFLNSNNIEMRSKRQSENKVDTDAAAVAAGAAADTGGKSIASRSNSSIHFI